MLIPGLESTVPPALPPPYCYGGAAAAGGTRREDGEREDDSAAAATAAAVSAVDNGMRVDESGGWLPPLPPAATATGDATTTHLRLLVARSLPGFDPACARFDAFPPLLRGAAVGAPPAAADDGGEADGGSMPCGLGYNGGYTHGGGSIETDGGGGSGAATHWLRGGFVTTTARRGLAPVTRIPPWSPHARGSDSGSGADPSGGDDGEVVPGGVGAPQELRVSKRARTGDDCS